MSPHEASVFLAHWPAVGCGQGQPRGTLPAYLWETGLQLSLIETEGVREGLGLWGPTRRSTAPVSSPGRLL